MIRKTFADALRAWPLWALLASLGGCATEFPGDPAPADVFEFPASIALHPNGRYLYVVNTNADLRFRDRDGGAVMVVDLERGEVVPSSTRSLGSFGGRLVLNHDASRGYLAVRSDSTITWFDISPGGRSISCPLAPNSGSLEACRHTVAEEPTGLAYRRAFREQPLLDPLGRPMLDEQGKARFTRVDFDLLGVAHLRKGQVSFVTVLTTPGLTAPVFSSTSAALVDAPSDILAMNDERFFVTGRLASSLLVCRPALGNDARVLGIYVDAELRVPTPFSSYEGRSLALSPSQDRLYLSNQSPNSLLVYDTSRLLVEGVPSSEARLIAMMDLPRDPNRMLFVERPGQSPLLYLTSFREDAVSVIDPDLPAIIAEVKVGDGPYDLVAGAPGSDRVYVSLFSEHGLAVLDVSTPSTPVLSSTISTPRTSP